MFKFGLNVKFLSNLFKVQQKKVFVLNFCSATQMGKNPSFKKDASFKPHLTKLHLRSNLWKLTTRDGQQQHMPRARTA